MALVDLSLFDISPTNDNHFIVNEEIPSASALPSKQATLRNAATMKPLPPIPHRRLGAFTPDPRSNVANPTRTILERVRRMRVDSSLAPEDCLSQQQTLQQRRNPNSTTPTLTIPTPSHYGNMPRCPASAAAAASPRPAAPMIWLAEEEMWLVADAVEPTTESSSSSTSHRDLYGYYAPAPHTDPGPYGYYADSLDFDNLQDSPPAYSASTVSSTQSADLSPIQAQFSSLLDARGSSQLPSTAQTTPEQVSFRDDRRGPSPTFQEAISGMSFGVGYESWGRRESRDSRRESWHSGSGVSPVSAGTASTETPSRWRVQRTASART